MTDNFEVFNDNNAVAVVDSSITTVNNEIYFSCGINDKSISKLITELRKLEVRNTKISVENKIPAPPIKLFINSQGGSIFAGIAGMEAIKNMSVPVYSIVNGCCGSAATLLSLVAYRRLISENSYMLIHQVSSHHWGNYEQLKDSLENSKQFMKMIKNVYLEYTDIPKRKLKKILKRDLWFEADRCIDLGLADEIWFKE